MKPSLLLWVDKTLAQWFIFLIRKYKSKGGGIRYAYIECNFNPSCSGYTIDAIVRFGFFRGIALAKQRIFQCNNKEAIKIIDDPLPRKLPESLQNPLQSIRKEHLKLQKQLLQLPSQCSEHIQKQLKSLCLHRFFSIFFFLFGIPYFYLKKRCRGILVLASFFLSIISWYLGFNTLAMSVIGILVSLNIYTFLQSRVLIGEYNNHLVKSFLQEFQNKNTV